MPDDRFIIDIAVGFADVSKDLKSLGETIQGTMNRISKVGFQPRIDTSAAKRFLDQLNTLLGSTTGVFDKLTSTIGNNLTSAINKVANGSTT